MQNFKILFFIFMILCSVNLFAQGALSDEAITLAVATKINKNPDVKKFNVEVKAQSGIVSLSGEVNTLRDVTMLVELAESIDGVQDVIIPGLVTAGGSQGLNDAVIAGKIMGTYLRKRVFGDIDMYHLPVVATSNNGLVFLDGTVDNRVQFLSSIKIAQQIQGVHRVISRLNIRFSNVNMGS